MVGFYWRILDSTMVLIVMEENESAELDADRHLLQPAAHFVSQG